MDHRHQLKMQKSSSLQQTYQTEPEPDNTRRAFFKVEDINVPQDVWLELMTWLNGKSLVALSKTCRYFLPLTKIESLWRNICIRECPKNIPVSRYLGSYQRLWQHRIYLTEEYYAITQIFSQLNGCLLGDESDPYPLIKRFRKILQWEFDAPEIPAETLSLIGRLLDKYKTPKIQLDLCCCIANITASNQNVWDDIVVIPGLLSITNTSHHPKVLIMALNALRNIAGDGLPNRDYLINEGSALKIIVSSVEKNINKTEPLSKQIINSALMLATALTRKKPAPPLQKVGVLLPVLKRLINYEDNDILENALWTYSGLTEQSSQPHLSAVAEQQIYSRLVQLANRPNYNITYPATRVIGNIMVSDTEAHTRAFIDGGILSTLQKFLKRPELALRKESMWTLSNIAATSPACIQSIVDHGLINIIIRKIGEDDDFVRKEAVFTITNCIWKGNAQQAKIMVEGGCLPLMIALATTTTLPPVLQAVIENFDNLLRPEIPEQDRIEYATKISTLARGFLLEVARTSTNRDLVEKTHKLLSSIPSGR